MTTILHLEGLGKQLQPPDGPWLFRDLHASVTEPVIISILGKSGQGKSTLLRILARLTATDSGTMQLHGRDVKLWTPEAWRMKVSYVAQQPVMLPGNVEDNLRTAANLHQRSFDLKQARQCMEWIGLDHLEWTKDAQQLSGGEKQRLALIRTLLLQPDVLLLDEVTSSLDAISKQATERLLCELHAHSGTTILWVTHDWEEARKTSQRIWFMADGRLLEDADCQTFFDSPRTEEAKAFLRSSHVRAESLEGVR